MSRTLSKGARLLDVNKMEKSPLGQDLSLSELRNLKNVEICLSGHEIYSLIVAAQLFQSDSADLDVAKAQAKTAARKLHKKLACCPKLYNFLDQGWVLKETLNSKANDTNS